MNLTAVSFHTPEYTAEVALLRASLRRVGMGFIHVCYPDRGSWDANTAIKPEFLKFMRDGLRGPLLYIDVDAFVHQNCETYFKGLAAEGVDFGAHWFAGPAFGHDVSKVRDEGWWMLSGTIFLGDTKGARLLLDEWLAENEAQRKAGNRAGGGQKNLQTIIDPLEKAGLKVARLPGRYCYVFDKPWAYPKREPCIIEHTIASREHRGRQSVKGVQARQSRKEVLWGIVEA